MEMPTMEMLIKLTKVKELRGVGNSYIYNAISEGTFPTPVKLGRASLWIYREVAEMNAAAIQELSKEETRALVSRLLEERKKGAK